MGTRKRLDELIFNLKWKNKLDNGGDKSNIIGMYDTPTTTSNFQMFKSYLLKNSGVAGNDVKVTYLTDDGQEWDIDSQDWFEIALNAFRLKARLGEEIRLKLQKITNVKHHIMRKHSNDVETQSDVDAMANSTAGPPEWFLTYMKQFKRDVIEEITVAVSSNSVPNSKEDGTCFATTKRIKPDASKRSKKHFPTPEILLDKEILKTLKFDRKLENKLDKLDAKTKKIKEKKQALINRLEYFDPKVGRQPRPLDKGCFPIRFNTDEMSCEIPNIFHDFDVPAPFNATLVNSSSGATYEHMIGGEVYLHTWDVKNSGEWPWSPYTELRVTWGSSELKPSVKSVRCPCLLPGETGSISVRFEIPEKPGTYESYWNFYERSIRFGCSLSCCVIVEEPLASVISEETLNTSTDKSSPAAKLTTNPKGVSEKPITSDEVNGEQPKREIVVIGPRKDSCEVMKPATQSKTKEEDSVKFENILKAFLSPSQGESSETKEENSSKITAPENVKVEALRKSFCETVSTKDLTFYIQKKGEADPHQPTHCLKMVAPREMWKAEGTTKVAGIEIEANVRNAELYFRPYKPEEEHDYIWPKTESSLPDFAVDLSPRVAKMWHEESVSLEPDGAWGNLSAFVRSKDEDEVFVVNPGQTTNKYGITENDLIVDLSKNSNENSVVEQPTEKVEVKEEVNTHDDDNNNNGSLDNNNSPRDSISEVASNVSSDLSSGYDILSTPVCEEKEDDDGSGYVYVTIDGNKLSVPKHILRPDFLAQAEEAPVPQECNDDENSVEPKETPIETVPDEASSSENTKTDPPSVAENVMDKSIAEMSHCSTACSSFSDVNGGRLFIFPQNQPGYEVVDSLPSENQQSTETVTANNEVPLDNLRQTCIQPDTHNPVDNVHHVGQINLGNLKMDPYGPLDQSQATPVGRVCPTLPLQELPLSPPTADLYRPMYFYPPTSFMLPTVWPSGHVNPQHCQQFQHLHNYQQSPPNLRQQPAANNLRQHPAANHLRQHPAANNVCQYPAANNVCQQPAANNLCQQPAANNLSQQPAANNLSQQSASNPCEIPPFNIQEGPTAPPQDPNTDQAAGQAVPVHILPENLVNGAVNVASSAINTARSVINMIVPPKSEPGRWVNGHWITENPESLRAKNLCILAEMGFWDADLNATLLARYNDDIARVVSELIQ